MGRAGEERRRAPEQSLVRRAFDEGWPAVCEWLPRRGKREAEAYQRCRQQTKAWYDKLEAVRREGVEHFTSRMLNRRRRDVFSRRYHPFPLTGLRLEMDRVIVPGVVARRIALSGMRYDDELAVKVLGAGFTGRRCRLSFVLEGSARLHVGQTAADLRPGQFFFSPDAQQQWTQTDHLEVLELDWEPEGLASPMGSRPAHGTLGPSAHSRVRQLVKTLSLARRQAPLAFAAQFTGVIEVMAGLGASVNRDFRLGEAPQPNEWLFEKVDEVLEGLDKNPQSVDLELRTGLPRQKLSRLVKDLHQQFALTGTSDSSWRSVRNFYRLLIASIILGHPEAHPARVSRLVGFGSLEAMDHAYANAGMPTPEQLRRRIRGLPRQTISNGLER